MQRPTSITTFGILNIIFAGMGVFGIISIMALLTMTAASADNNPVIRIMLENPAYTMWMKVSIPLGVLAIGVLLAAGVGLLRMKNWGRTLSISYAIYAIVIGILSTVLNILLVVPPALEEASRLQGPEAAGAMGGVIGGAIGGCFGLIYPIVLLIFMTRPKLVAALRTATPPSLPPTQ